MTTGQIMKDEQRFRAGFCQKYYEIYRFVLNDQYLKQATESTGKEDTVTTTEQESDHRKFV